MSPKIPRLLQVDVPVSGSKINIAETTAESAYVQTHGGWKIGLLRKIANYEFSITTSTRRLRARPRSESFDAIGRLLP